MNVAPPLERTRRYRHFSCPECQASLEQVRTESSGTVTYVCRMGHRYGPAELLVGKEEALEQLLWKSLAAMDELIVLIDELGEVEELQVCAEGCRQRAANASTLRAALEQVVASNEPAQLDPDRG